MKNFTGLISLLLLFCACANVNKMLDRGEYDKAISHLTKKLEGKKEKKKEYILALEFAFQKAQEADLRQEAGLRDENISENWSRIYAIHNKISARQQKIEPFLPLISVDGYQATFKFVNVDELKKESKKNTADFYYQSALTLIDDSRRSADKLAARKAYDYLLLLDGLFNQYKDKEQLKKVAYSLAQENYLVKITNNTKNIIPQEVETELLKLSVEGLNKKYKNFEVKPNPMVQYDHYIIMDLTQLEFSPERERSRIYDDVNEVITEETVKDKFGKPKRDSTGKEIKQKITTKYTATIEEISQLKSVILAGRLEYTRALSGEIEFSKPIQVEAIFENHLARMVKGDRNYVTDECRKKLNGKALPFPRNEELMLDAAEKMKVLVKNIIYEREK